MNRGRKFLSLSREEKAALVAALLLLPAVRIGLRTLGLRRVLAVLVGRLKPEHPVNAADQDRVAGGTARLVAVAARLEGGTCLARSIVLVALLERRGIPAGLRIGVRKGEEGLEAHAWVEAGGTILNDARDVSERFAPFDRDFATARVSWQ